MLKRRCVPKGFTLIELLVVIAVLALLLSVIMPSLAKAKELARRTVCLSHMGQLGLICVTYAHENNDWFPDYNVHPGPHGVTSQSSDPRSVFDGGNGDARSVWVGYVADYTIEGGTDIFYCPSDKTITREKRWPNNPLNPHAGYMTGYAYWGNFGKESYYYNPTYWASRIPPPRKTLTVKTSAIVPVFGDWVRYSEDMIPIPWLITHSKTGRSKGWLSDEPKGMNSAYADGSARWCHYKGDKSDEFSAIVQWSGINIRFWGVPRALEKQGYGLP